jgi:glutathione S-transferase
LSRSARYIYETNIDVETKGIDMSTGEHKKPEFRKIDPLGKLPEAQ